MRWVPVLAVLALLAVSAVVHASVTTTVTVIGPSNTPLANAVVQAYQSNSMVAQGTTGSSGSVSLTLPSNTTTTFLVSWGGNNYIIETFTSIPASLTINATTYFQATIATNTTYTIPVTVSDSGNTITIYTNATVFSTDSNVQFTFPNQTTVNLFTTLEFVNMTVNGTPQTSNTATITFNANYNIVAYYAVMTLQFMGIPLNTTTLVIVLAIVAVLLAIVVVYTRHSAQKKIARSYTPTWL